LLTHLAVHDEGLHDALRLLDASAMSRQEHGILAPQQLVERSHVGGHVAFWRRDHGCIPAHDVIAREHDARSLDGKA
jgi:hypothetical protein